MRAVRAFLLFTAGTLANMGARLNSGPAPNPNAVRRNRREDIASWTTLPPTGLQGDIPEWPLEVAERPTSHEQALWDRLWREQPQAHIWTALGMELQVATYVRTALHAATFGARAVYLTAARQQADALLLNPSALRSNRYRIAINPEEVTEPDRPVAATTGPASVTPLHRPGRGSGVLGRIAAAVASEEEEDDEPDAPEDE